LVEQAGTPERAKKAIDVSQQRQQPLPAREDEFVKQLGYVSCLEMFEASTPIMLSSDGKTWCITPVADGQWLAWCQEEVQAGRKLGSREAAVRYVEEVARR
jgi:hypothetical protein